VGEEERTNKEKKVIEVLRLHVCKTFGEPIQHESYPEEIRVYQGERPCDATWRGPREGYAVEHTTIDSFVGQRHDDARFHKLMGTLEKKWSNHPDDWLEIAIDVTAIPTGVDWGSLSNQIQAWLIQNVPSLPCECQSIVKIPNVPIDLHICREKLPGQGRVIVARLKPGNLSEQRIAVIRNALDKKTEVLRQYKNRGDETVLLIESSDCVLSNREIIFKDLRNAYRPEPDSPVLDQITSPRLVLTHGALCHSRWGEK
jgi:hypothetical protein